MNDDQLKKFVKNLFLTLVKSKVFDKLLRIRLISRALIDRVGIERAINFAAQYTEPTLLSALLRKDFQDKALFYAALGNRLDNIRVLKNSGANYDDAILAGAARSGNMDLVKQMLPKTRMINWALIEASRGGQVEMVKFLIKNGASWLEDVGREAVKAGHLSVVKLLVEDISIDTIFSWAEHFKRPEIMLWLVEMDVEHSTYLLKVAPLVAKQGNLDLLKQILAKTEITSVKHGDVTIHFTQTYPELGDILTCAMEGNQQHIVDYLLTTYGITSFGKALGAALKTGNKEMFSLILAKAIKSEAAFDSVIIVAAELGDIELVKSMFDLGTKIVDLYMKHAALHGHIEIVEMMLDKGALDFDSVATEAAKGGHLDVILLLNARTMNLGGRMNWDKILVEAVSYGHKNVVEEALKHVTSSLFPAFSRAVGKDRYNIVDMLAKRATLPFDKVVAGILQDKLSWIRENIDSARGLMTEIEMMIIKVGKVSILKLLEKEIKYWNTVLSFAWGYNRILAIKFVVERGVLTLDDFRKTAKKSANYEAVDYIKSYVL